MLVIFDDDGAWQIGQGADRAMPLRHEPRIERAPLVERDDGTRGDADAAEGADAEPRPAKGCSER